MTVWGETDEDGGVSGERENCEEVVEGGDKHDFSGILMGFTKLDEYRCNGGDGERDRSLLVSLLLSSDNMMRLRILFFSGKDAEKAQAGCILRFWIDGVRMVECDISAVGIEGGCLAIQG